MAGKIKKLLENELVGGTQSTDVYPVTSVKAVYDENNERLDHILARRGVVNMSTSYGNESPEVLSLSQAIDKVPVTDRVVGFTGKFLSSSGWVICNFIGDTISDWSDTSNWSITNLSQKGSSVIKELYCSNKISNIGTVTKIRFVNGDTYKQVFLQDINGTNIDAISLEEDGSTPYGVYKGKNEILYNIDNWDTLPSGESFAEFTINHTNYDLNYSPVIKAYLSRDKYVTDNDVINAILPEIYLFPLRGAVNVDNIQIKVFDSGDTLQVFLNNGQIVVAAIGYYGAEIPPRVLDLQAGNGDVICKVVLNYEAALGYISGTYTAPVNFNLSKASEIENFPTIMGTLPNTGCTTNYHFNQIFPEIYLSDHIISALTKTTSSITFHDSTYDLNICGYIIDGISYGKTIVSGGDYYVRVNSKELLSQKSSGRSNSFTTSMLESLHISTIVEQLTRIDGVSDNNILNRIVPELYLNNVCNAGDVKTIQVKILSEGSTRQVFFLGEEDRTIASHGWYNNETPPLVCDVGGIKCIVNWDAVTEGTNSCLVNLREAKVTNIDFSPTIKQYIELNPALYYGVSTNPIVNGVIYEMLLPSSIDYSLVKRVRFVNGEQYKQIFLQNEDGTINYDSISLLGDGSTPYGMYRGQNRELIYLINNWNLLPSGVSEINCTLNSKVTNIDFNPNIKSLLYQYKMPTDSPIVNSVLKEIYLNGVCSPEDVKSIRIVKTEAPNIWYQIFFKRGIEETSENIVAVSIGLNSIESKVYDLNGIKVYVDAEEFNKLIPNSGVYLIPCTLSENTVEIDNWDKILNYMYHLDVNSRDSILWLGTSIPAGSPWGTGYPKMVGERLSVKVYNNAIGASFITYSTDKPSPDNESEDYKCFSLSQTRKEKQTLFGDVISGWSEDRKEGALSYGYDNLIIPYIDGTKASCNVIVFDHGWNDQNRGLRDMYSKIEDGSINDEYMQSRDRTTFIGAFNYIYDRILEVKPNIRIIIAGYHENESNGSAGPNNVALSYYGKQVCAVQEYIANYYGFPIIKMWEKCNFTFRQIVPNTSGYLQKMGYSRNAFVKDSNGNISVFDYYHPDGIHPFSGEKAGGAMGETFLSKIFSHELTNYM